MYKDVVIIYIFMSDFVKAISSPSGSETCYRYRGDKHLGVGHESKYFYIHDLISILTIISNTTFLKNKTEDIILGIYSEQEILN